MSLVTSSPTNQGRTTKPRPARQSGSLSGNAQTSRRRLAMTRRHGRNINANHGAKVFKRGMNDLCRFSLLMRQFCELIAFNPKAPGFPGLPKPIRITD
jgi:hypothetical protein